MKKSTKDFERRKKIVKKLKPIDDTFFEVIMQDREVCEEVLQVILQDKLLKVLEVIPQKSIKNLQGRSVRLDAHCILENERYCNVEVQKENVDNHFKRCRYNASCITANITETGDNFENIPDVYIVYISRFDMFKKGKTIYHAGMKVEETGEALNDGLHEIFVNTKINDGSNIAKLMKCFEQESVNEKSFPKFSARVTQLKEDEREGETMCSLVEEYANEKAVEILILDNLEEEIPKERIISKLRRRFELTEKEAEEYFERYAAQTVK